MADFIAFSRFIALKNNLISQIRINPSSGNVNQPGQFTGYLGMVSKENEVAAWGYILKVVDEALNRYQTTLKGDFDLLNKHQQLNNLT